MTGSGHRQFPLVKFTGHSSPMACGPRAIHLAYAISGMAQAPECGCRRGRLQSQLSPRFCERRYNPLPAACRSRIGESRRLEGAAA